MAELADALDLKSNGYLIPVPVRVRPPARRICGVADFSLRVIMPDRIQDFEINI